MCPVHMGCHQHLTAGEELLRQFQADLVGLGGSKVFFWREGLSVLIEEGSVVLPVEPFGGHEALHGHICHAVDACEIAVTFLVHGLLWLGYILNHPSHAPCRLLALFDEATGCHGGSPVLSPPVH